jgi:hypothetical protein
MVEIPGLDSEEMKILQLVLDVLSIYWQPLRELVLNTCPQTQALKLIWDRQISLTAQSIPLSPVVW